jgi:hypothetical protein
MAKLLDLIGQGLMFLAFGMPFLTIYWVWQRRNETKIVKFTIGLSLGVGLGLLCVFLSLFIRFALLLRHSLGPPNF